MPNSSLSQPVGALMRSTARVEAGSSLEVAARRMRENGAPVLPLVEGVSLLGVLTESSLAKALGEGASSEDSADLAVDLRPLTISPYTSGAEALRLLVTDGAPGLVVVDDEERVLGVLTASDLYSRRSAPMRPPLIGGMATPFGVYLTTGTVRAGVGDLALVTTGMLLFILLISSTFAAIGVTYLLGLAGLSDTGQDYAAGTLQFALFALLMRLIPLSGTHAAEHMVVHAIERGEELRPEIVRRMPRVHPRCGTNIAVGAALFFSLGSAAWIPAQELRLLVALLTTLFLWRPLGGFVQQWVTTRPPTPRQVESGIRSGTELLERYKTARVAVPSFPQRLWNSGMLHVLAGSAIVFCLIQLIASLLKIEIPL